MPNQASVVVAPPPPPQRRRRSDKFAGVDVYVEFLDGTRAWVPMKELESLRRAFRFVQPPGQA